MSRYILQRLGMLLLILLGVLVITFVISRVLPGSAVEMMLGARPTEEQIAAVREQLGLDRSMPEQLLLYIGDTLRGEFGTSLLTKRPVLVEIAERFPATLELVFFSLILVVCAGIPMGVSAALHKNSTSDYAARSVSALGAAMPTFIVAMILQLVFSGWLGVLPLQGRIDGLIQLDYEFPTVTGFYTVDSLLAGQWAAFKSCLLHLIMPVLALSLSALAIIMRITRGMMIEALGEEFIMTLRAYGLSPRKVNYGYALKAALIPLLTVIGMTFGYMLGLSVVVEYVFDWPGIGGFMVGAIVRSDYPAVMGVTLVLASSYLIANLIVDLLHFAADPRLR
ncbi:ABC transporter permease [Defluviimonas salinarum]|uniref:ABC transporter permease n=1 Tax=Defluviimonas salinarum TaxID=2992147 RepID=A0ABT3J7G7_9RHOB|nr:ABC transporter permease [Defluviimonas salinarum]MCW3783633.1 ABC transporter permease [Defluviimonas salinarum]